MVLNIFLIQFILVAAIDVLGFVDEGLTPLVKKLTGSKIWSIGKPFNCSTCLTWWTSLLYILFTGNFTLLNIGLCMAAALLTPITLDLIMFVKDLLGSFITVARRFTGVDYK